MAQKMQEEKKVTPKRELVFEYQVTLGSGDAARTFMVKLPERLEDYEKRKHPGEKPRARKEILSEMLLSNDLTPHEKGKLVLKGDATMIPKNADYAQEHNNKPQNARLDIFRDQYLAKEDQGVPIKVAEMPKLAKEKKG
jgi:hypothetical protein